jgi:hypothetical protein
MFLARNFGSAKKPTSTKISSTFVEAKSTTASPISCNHSLDERTASLAELDSSVIDPRNGIFTKLGSLAVLAT